MPLKTATIEEGYGPEQRKAAIPTPETSKLRSFKLSDERTLLRPMSSLSHAFPKESRQAEVGGTSHKKGQRSHSMDETLVDVIPIMHCRSASAFSTTSTGSPHHSSHHSIAPLLTRYESTPDATTLVEPGTFSVFHPDQIIINKEGSEYDFYECGSDEEKQPLLNTQNHDRNNKGVVKKTDNVKKQETKKGKSGEFIYNLMYAVLSTMMAIPSLYGYASVIFNNDVYQPHISTLSKLVIWSSAVHQLTFVGVSSLSFAKAEVQDAGLLFLSCMSNHIATSVLDEGGGIEEILSTTVVTLGVATATLGLVLMFLGKFNCADAVSYLPLPVVGGYLAFIGYFCVIAGVGLCTSKSMIDGGFWGDMELLMGKQTLLLALPGLFAGLLLMLIARLAQNDAALPIAMFAIPVFFYAVLYLFGYSLDDAREGKWVGEVQPTASVTSLIDLVDFGLVRWDLVFSTRCVTVWLGMVFVVSFSSCLDVGEFSSLLQDRYSVSNNMALIHLVLFFIP